MPTMRGTMKEYTLPRTGQSDIIFTGELLAEAKSPAYRRSVDQPTTKNHWFECDVYRTKGGKLIVHLKYRWSGKLYRESHYDDVTVVERNPAAVLLGVDPSDYVTGYPEGEYWAEKQQNLLTSIREDYDLLVEAITNQLMKHAEPERVE